MGNTNTMTAEKRARLEARRAQLRAEMAAKRVREFFLANYHRAVFGAEAGAEDAAERIYRGLGR